jgi:hypothetical protein
VLENWLTQFETFENGCIKNEAFEFKYIFTGLAKPSTLSVSLKSQVNI